MYKKSESFRYGRKGGQELTGSRATEGEEWRSTFENKK